VTVDAPEVEPVGKFAMRVALAAPGAEASRRWAERADRLAALLTAEWEEEHRDVVATDMRKDRPVDHEAEHAFSSKPLGLRVDAVGPAGVERQEPLRRLRRPAGRTGALGVLSESHGPCTPGKVRGMDVGQERTAL
jgi:hypothetical protein